MRTAPFFFGMVIILLGTATSYAENITPLPTPDMEGGKPRFNGAGSVCF